MGRTIPPNKDERTARGTGETGRLADAPSAPRKKTAKATPIDDAPCGPVDDDSDITNVGGSASGRREPHGCTHLKDG